MQRGWRPDAIGGLTLGADPVSYAIAYASQLAGIPIRAFTVRKEAKAHGTGKVIEGAYESGRPRGRDRGRDHDGRLGAARDGGGARGGRDVVGVLAVVDREEGGREAIEQRRTRGAHAHPRLGDRRRMSGG